MTDGPVVLGPDLLRELVVGALEAAEQRLGWHGRAVGAASRFGQILLVIVLGEIEGLISQDFGGDAAVALFGKGSLIDVPAGEGLLQMLLVEGVDR